MSFSTQIGLLAVTAGLAFGWFVNPLAGLFIIGLWAVASGLALGEWGIRL